MTTLRMFTAELSARAQDWVVRRKGRLRSIALIAAIILFIVGLALSLKATPDLLERLRLWPLLIVLFLIIPVTIVLSALDFQLLAKLSGARAGFWRAAEVVIYTRAANMLPIPGSIAVRMAVLKGAGTTFRRSGGLMVLFTLIWGGIGFCYSAFWLSVQGILSFASAFTFVGLLILTACIVLARRFRAEPSGLVGAALLRFGMIALEAMALVYALEGVGVSANYEQSAILVVASFSASVVPVGLGVRETLIAALAPVAGIDPASGFLAAAIVRFLAMSFLALTSVGLLFAGGGFRPMERLEKAGAKHVTKPGGAS